MKSNTEVHLDADGNIDTAYYIRKAHQLRNDFMSATLVAVSNKLKGLFPIQLPTIAADRPTQHE